MAVEEEKTCETVEELYASSGLNEEAKKISDELAIRREYRANGFIFDRIRKVVIYNTSQISTDTVVDNNSDPVQNRISRTTEWFPERQNGGTEEIGGVQVYSYLALRCLDIEEIPGKKILGPGEISPCYVEIHQQLRSSEDPTVQSRGKKIAGIYISSELGDDKKLMGNADSLRIPFTSVAHNRISSMVCAAETYFG